MAPSPEHMGCETAILFTAPPWPRDTQPVLDEDTPLAPILGRCLLQRAIEQLVRLGARHVRVMLDENATGIRDMTQSGERWGCTVSYHYPDPRSTLRNYLAAIGIGPSQRCILGNAWSFPLDTPLSFASVSDAGTALYAPDHDTGSPRWIGWGCVTGSWLSRQDLPVDASALALAIHQDVELHKPVSDAAVVASCPAALLAGVSKLLDLQGGAAYVSPLAHVHPNARLIAPCNIGRSAWIDANAVIGPHAVIEEGARVSAGVHIENSLVLPGTYVGPDLELKKAVVRGHVLLNAALGSRTDVTDPHLLSHLSPAAPRVGTSSRLLAGILRIALLPLYRHLRKRQRVANSLTPRTRIPVPSAAGAGLASTQVALLPPQPAVPDQPYDWAQHFVGTFYPGLSAIWQGKLRFTGPTIKSWHAVAQLPNEWKRLHERCSCGLLNTGWIQSAPASGSDDTFACDALAAAHPETPRVIAQHLRPYLNLVWNAVRDHQPRHTPHPPQKKAA